MKNIILSIFALLFLINIGNAQLSDGSSDQNFKVYTDNGFYVKVTNKYDYSIKYSFEYDLTDIDNSVTTYTCANYVVTANTIAGNLFTATNTTKVTRIKMISFIKVETTAPPKNGNNRRRL